MGKYRSDVLERAAMTFAQSFLGAVVVTDLSSVRTAALAGVAAVVSLLKSLLAVRTGDGTPNLLG